MRVLAVDDDADILATLCDQLELRGIEVDCAYSGRQAVVLAANTPYDVILLDVMMSGGDGLSACRELRQTGNTTPILFLTARDTLDDKLSGFGAGGDDYLVKPFAMSELLCRVEALARRISRHKVRLLRVGDLELDVERNIASREGSQLRLNSLQFRLLQLMMQQAPKMVSREVIEAALWGGQPPDSDALKSHIYQLRMILDKPFASPMLETVRGQGYRLNVDAGEMQ